MNIVACSILNKDKPEKKVRQIPTILKREAIERKDSIKVNWYQQKDIRLLSKKILSPLKDIKKEIAVLRLLKGNLLCHKSEIFHKAERQRPRPNWNSLMDQLTSEEKKKKKKKVQSHCFQ